MLKLRANRLGYKGSPECTTTEATIVHPQTNGNMNNHLRGYVIAKMKGKSPYYVFKTLTKAFRRARTITSQRLTKTSGRA